MSGTEMQQVNSNPIRTCSRDGDGVIVLLLALVSGFNPAQSAYVGNFHPVTSNNYSWNYLLCSVNSLLSL